eukprot:sb/3463679/
MAESVHVGETVTKTESGDSKYTLYKVKVQKPNGANWFVLRRYKEFDELCSLLQRSDPQEMARIRLPGKRLFGNLDPVKVQKPNGANWFVLRRYKEFDELCSLLQRSYPQEMARIRLPGKRLFGNLDPASRDLLEGCDATDDLTSHILTQLMQTRPTFFSLSLSLYLSRCLSLSLSLSLSISLSLSSGFIRQRMEGLDRFVAAIFETDSLRSSVEVQKFLAMDRHTEDGGTFTYPSDDSTGCASDLNDDGINLGSSHNKSARPHNFEYLKVIGTGSFGKVILARQSVNGEKQYYAIKVVDKQSILKRNEAKHIMAERNVLIHNVKHPFLVSLKYSFKTNEKLFFVLDYVNGGELFFHLQRERTFHESRARFYAAEIASAIGYLHSIDIIYRDLKPENILLDKELSEGQAVQPLTSSNRPNLTLPQGHIKLTDFGLCKEGIALNKTTNTFCGTPEYLAPEVIQKQPYTNAVDWWCLGAVLYEMIFGLPPFYSKDTREMYENILYKPIRFKSHVSLHAKRLLEGLLQKQVNNRLGSSSRDVLPL